MMQRVVILGSTGSIGVNTLDVIAMHPQRYQVYALTAATRVDSLFAQCCAHQPQFAVMADADSGRALQQRCADAGLAVQVRWGAQAIAEVAADRADCGVVPLEDPAYGLVNHTLDELAATELSICAEITLGSGEDGPVCPAARYIVLGRSANAPSGHDQTMLMLRIENKPGALVSALEPFKELAINLNHFSNRPAMKGSNDIFFFVQAEGHTRELQGSDLFRDLSKKCRAVKVLGSYPKAEA